MKITVTYTEEELEALRQIFHAAICASGLSSITDNASYFSKKHLEAYKEAQEDQGKETVTNLQRKDESKEKLAAER